MDRNTAVTTWREVCGSDAVMASMPPTGRMLEDFARRIEAAERERCAAICESLSVEAGRNRQSASSLEGDTGYECAGAIRGPNVADNRLAEGKSG